jgi:hypothetical protein
LAGHLRGLQTHAHQLAVGQRRRQLGHGQAGVIDHLAADHEGLRRGVEVGDHATQLVEADAGFGLDAGGDVAARGRVEQRMHLDHGAFGQRGKAAGEVVIEHRAGRCLHRLAQHHQRACRRVHAVDRADDLTAEADAQRLPACRAGVDMCAIDLDQHA